MKIAFIVSKFPALSETFILDQITGLIDRGHEVDIYSSMKGDDSTIHPDIEKYNLLTRTYYRPNMPSNFVLTSIKGLVLFLMNFIKNPKIMLRTLDVFKFWKKAFFFTLVYKVIPFLPSKSYDIVHCHFGANGLSGVFLREIEVLKGKVITSFHGYDLTQYVKEKGRDVYKFLFEKGELFLPVSNYLKDRLIELGCNEDKILVHYMGINSGKFPFRSRGMSDGGVTRIITIGRLIEKKGIAYGIRAVRRLKKEKLNVEYNIIGRGPLKKELESLIEELGLTEEVKLLGAKNHQEVISLLDYSHILLAPSVTASDADQEGIPIVLMEAMAMGLLVVSTHYSGIPELIEEEKTGLLAGEKDVNAISEKIARLIKHPEISEKMAQFAHAFIEEHFEVEKLNDSLVRIYESLA